MVSGIWLDETLKVAEPYTYVSVSLWAICNDQLASSTHRSSKTLQAMTLWPRWSGFHRENIHQYSPMRLQVSHYPDEPPPFLPKHPSNGEHHCQPTNQQAKSSTLPIWLSPSTLMRINKSGVCILASPSSWNRAVANLDRGCFSTPLWQRCRSPPFQAFPP